VKTGTYINAHKALVIPVVLGLMSYYRNWSTEACVYLAIHGSYSILWLIKQSSYPDRRFDKPQPLWIGLLFVFLPLAGYYAAPYLLISRHVAVPPALVVLALSLYAFGIFLHFVGDAQKYYTLRLKKGLIREGLFARTRNPNYLGEILTYLAYAVLAMHWLPYLIVAAWGFGFFLPSMLRKDQSLSRYPEFPEYRARTGLLLPKLW
jgi:protein-S-isoprenylcysteine O-methyltransferase Ste14